MFIRSHLWNYRLLAFMSTTVFDKVNATSIFIFQTFFLYCLFSPPTISHFFSRQIILHILMALSLSLRKMIKKNVPNKTKKICISAFFFWCESLWCPPCLGRNFLSCQQPAIINDLLFRNFFGFEQCYCKFLLQAQPEQVTFLFFSITFFTFIQFNCRSYIFSLLLIYNLLTGYNLLFWRFLLSIKPFLNRLDLLNSSVSFAP